MKKNLFFVIVLLFSTGLLYAQADKVLGYWLTEKKGSQVRIFKATDGKFYGKVDWLEDDRERLDTNNPDANLSKQKVLGSLILKGFKYNESKKQWEGGTIYDPENGKTYTAFMWFEEDLSTLHIKGYVMGMKFIGRQTLWTRENELRK
ncbi:MAG: hypothetical protein A2Y87_03335 [Bacteroidetes bacterium RBG_13_46_8]|nr:MAG: hypothetical protein A2Y87_03335 [Bacteroidetes bacterium RBG_13_46_8]